MIPFIVNPQRYGFKDLRIILSRQMSLHLDLVVATHLILKLTRVVVATMCFLNFKAFALIFVFQLLYALSLNL